MKKKEYSVERLVERLSEVARDNYQGQLELMRRAKVFIDCVKEYQSEEALESDCVYTIGQETVDAYTHSLLICMYEI